MENSLLSNEVFTSGQDVDLYRPMLQSLPLTSFLCDRNKNFVNLYNSEFLLEGREQAESCMGTNLRDYTSDSSSSYYELFVKFNHVFDQVLETGESGKFHYEINGVCYESGVSPLGDHIVSYVSKTSAAPKEVLPKADPLPGQPIHKFNQYELILDNANAGFVYIDSQYRVVWENTSRVLSQEILDELCYFTVGKLCYDNDGYGECLRELIEPAFILRSVRKVEKQLPSSRYVELTVSPAIHKDGSMEGVVLKIEDISEQKSYIQQLKQSEHRIAANNALLLTIIDSLPCSLYIKNAEDNFRYELANKKFCDLIESSNEELRGKTDYDIFPKEYADRFREDDHYTVGSGVTRVIDEQIVPFGETSQVWHVIKSSLFDPNENKTLLIGVGLDITEHKEAITRVEKTERETAAANQLLSAILNNLPIMLFIKDIDDDYRYMVANKVFCSYFGIEKEEDIVGKVDHEIFPSKEAHHFRTDDLRIVEGRKQEMFEEEAAFVKGGPVYIFHTIKTPLFGIENNKNLLLGITVDITDRVMFQRQMQYANTLMELTFAAGGIIPWEWNYLTQIINSNNEISSICGSNVTVDQYADTCVHPDQKESFLADCYRMRNGYTDTLNCTVRLLHRGVYEWTHIAGKTILDPRTKQQKAVGICRIISKEVQKQEELQEAIRRAEQSDALKSSFLANMSHEIRTPLNAIVGFSQLVADADDEDRAAYLEIINSNSELLLRLINDILDLSKIEAGYVEYMDAPFDLTSVFHDMEMTMRPKPGVKLINAASRQKCIVNLDRFRVSQILTNFLTNAIKFTIEGNITMGYEIENHGIKLYVKDTGCGISEENIPKVFDRFEKFNTFAQGTGLGTAICKAIVEAYDGKIGVESSLGAGSCFWVWLPTYVSVEAQNKESKVNRPEVSGLMPTSHHTQRILLVEDNDSNYLLVSSMLKEYSLVRAINGAEAVDLVRKEKFDVVLMDIKMSVMDGLEATRIIRTFNKTIPIVALTANAFESDRVEALDAGCNSFLTKPIDKKKLIQTIQEYQS